MSDVSVVPTQSDIFMTYGVSNSAGMSRINSVKVMKVSTGQIYCSGDSWMYGTMRTTVTFAKPVVLPQGGPMCPAVQFSGSGCSIYCVGEKLSLVGTDGVVVTGPITSPAGQNVVFGSGSGVVDFGGSVLVGVGGQMQNANKYDVVAGTSVVTVNGMQVQLYVVPTVSGATYTLSTVVSCVGDDGASSGSFVLVARAKNVGGVVTVGGSMQRDASCDAELSGATIAYVASGTDIGVCVGGLAGVVIKWFGSTSVVRQLF